MNSTTQILENNNKKSGPDKKENIANIVKGLYINITMNSTTQMLEKTTKSQI